MKTIEDINEEKSLRNYIKFINYCKDIKFFILAEFVEYWWNNKNDKIYSIILISFPFIFENSLDFYIMNDELFDNERIKIEERIRLNINKSIDD